VFYVVLRGDIVVDIAGIIGGVRVVPEKVVGGEGRGGYCILYAECYDEEGDYDVICALDRFASDLADNRVDSAFDRLISVLNPDIALATPMALSPRAFIPAYLDSVLPYAMYWKTGIHSYLLTSLFALIDECAILYLDTTVFPLLIREVLLEEERQALSEVQSFYRRCRDKLRDIMTIEPRDESILVKFKDKKLYLDYLKEVRNKFQKSIQETAEEPT